MKDEIKNINWNDFHFLRSDYLHWGVIALLILCLSFLAYRESNDWKKNIAKHLQPYVIKKGTTWKSLLIRGSVIAMFVLGFLAFLGPTWSQIKAPAKKVKSQFVIALDLSKSMLTQDVIPNRLERAKFKIHDLLEADPRAETNLMVFSGSSHVAIPFTTDYKIILDQLDGLQPNMMPIEGTEFNSLFYRIDSFFEDNKAEGKILLLTDDLEDLSIELVSSFIQSNNVRLYVYPFATLSGEKIPAYKAESKLSTEKLNGLASIEGVDVLEMTLDDSDVKDLAKAISDNLVFEDNTDREDENWQDRGYWLIFPLAFLFLFSFRKGWTINMLLVGLFLSSCSKGENDKEKAINFKDLWFTEAYQAQQAYDDKDYLKAAMGFQDPMRKGVAYFKAGDYLSAQTAFEKDTTTNGLYNLGLTYAKLGKLEDAQEVFERVLKQDPSNINANNNLEQIIVAIDKMSATKLEETNLEEGKPKAKNELNKSPEDLSGGGQKATKKDMQKKRLEETVKTDKRKAKEMEDLPDNFKGGKGELPKNVLMRKVDDDPALFLTKKFRYQVKKGQVEVKKNDKKW